MKILGIETSCDETSAAVVVDGIELKSNILMSQESVHSQFGGIVPEVAARQHIIALGNIIKEYKDLNLEFLLIKLIIFLNLVTIIEIFYLLMRLRI